MTWMGVAQEQNLWDMIILVHEVQDAERLNEINIGRVTG